MPVALRWRGSRHLDSSVPGHLPAVRGNARPLLLQVSGGGPYRRCCQSPLGLPHYVDDARFNATNNFAFPQVQDKKGLQCSGS